MKCVLSMAKAKSYQQIQYQKNIDFFLQFNNKPNVVVGTHGREKTDLYEINLSDLNEFEIATSGEFVEFQTGRTKGEFKFILLNKRNGIPFHYIFLKVPDSDICTLVNVYNPTEGMNFKWSKDGKERIYLNSWRSCCPHPLDSIENYNKEQHGKNHNKYYYQLTDEEKRELYEKKPRMNTENN